MAALLSRLSLIIQIAAYAVRFFVDFVYRSTKARLIARQYRKRSEQQQRQQTSPEGELKKGQLNVVIIGASFAGYHAAKLLAESLPASSPYRIVVVEPNSHFQFTWLLPRFSVVSGYESKLFIPYGPYIKYNSDRVRWIQDRVVGITTDEVQLQSGKESIPWSFLVIATGSGQTNGLPSRVGVEDHSEGIAKLQALQNQIKSAEEIVIVGGGAAGVELAADAKETYPGKNITLVHSRAGLMHRFEKGLQLAALEALQNIKVRVILEDRVLDHVDGQYASLQSGGRIRCDCLIDCVGQKPAFNLVTTIAPGAIAASGHIKVKPTLQIADDNLPGVYVCGDVADVGISKPNARAAMMQATIAADNIVLATQGKTPKYVYRPHWIEGVIKLTLGLSKSVVHFSKGSSELLQWKEDKEITLMADETWYAMGVPPEASQTMGV